VQQRPLVHVRCSTAIDVNQRTAGEQTKTCFKPSIMVSDSNRWQWSR